MKTKEIITSLTLIILACIAIIEAIHLPFGTLRDPQSGFWPFILSLLLALLSLIYLLDLFRKKIRDEGVSFFESQGWKRVILIISVLVAFALFFEKLGYLISVFILMGLLLSVVKQFRWWTAWLGAFLTSILSYLIFGVILNTPLPSGILNF